VHGTLATWMGDPAKNRAWDLLCEAKESYDRVMSSGALDPAQKVAAGRQLALCESSDWFWWFGDYNPADAVSQFDRLYRRQLVNLYRLLGLAPPESLSQPISIGRGAPEQGGVNAFGPTRPDVGDHATARIRSVGVRGCCCTSALSMPHLDAVAEPSSTGLPTLASVCGRFCRRPEPATTARLTGYARISRATPTSSIPPRLPKPA